MDAIRQIRQCQSRRTRSHFKKVYKNLRKRLYFRVIGDREFGSGKLFDWFNKNEIPFYIRVKDNLWVKVRKRNYCKTKDLFNHLNSKMMQPFNMTVLIYGKKVYLAGSRSEKGELMIVATNQSPKNAIAIYLRRWEIESFFQGLKSRGFRFEQTHLTHLDRIEKLLSLLSIGFCWAHKVGEWRALKKAIVFNNYRTSYRPQFSYFR